MFVVLLRFVEGRDPSEHLPGHNAWIERGFADGVFLTVGTLVGGGGAVIASGEDRPDLDARVAADPLVAQGVVTAEVVEFSPARVDPRLAFVAA